jgi:hypothetical protein
MTAPMPWPDIRTAIADAIVEALDDTDWQVTKFAPVEPEDPAAWIIYPNASRHTIKGHLRYSNGAIRFAIGLTDPDRAQELLDELYRVTFWEMLEASLKSRGLDITVADIAVLPLDLDSGARMQVLEIPLDFVA